MLDYDQDIQCHYISVIIKRQQFFYNTSVITFLRNRNDLVVSWTIYKPMISETWSVLRKQSKSDIRNY